MVPSHHRAPRHTGSHTAADHHHRQGPRFDRIDKQPAVLCFHHATVSRPLRRCRTEPPTAEESFVRRTASATLDSTDWHRQRRTSAASSVSSPTWNASYSVNCTNAAGLAAARERGKVCGRLPAFAPAGRGRPWVVRPYGPGDGRGRTPRWYRRNSRRLRGGVVARIQHLRTHVRRCHHCGDRRPGSRVRARAEVGSDRAGTGPLTPTTERLLDRTRRYGPAVSSQGCAARGQVRTSIRPNAIRQ